MKQNIIMVGLFSVALTACSSLSMNQSFPVKVSNGILTGNNGMTLYIFDKDTEGKSVCNGPCTANWPPLLASKNDSKTGDYSVIVRDDGHKQWSFKGKPIYFWSKDTKPGDSTGDGFKGIWHVARP